ncbi:MAG: DUF805 domain-containing protein [Elusimicrobiaceae bacterium]|nr:DUF805 domain-containing protein [Elusimicrobiaceae bacterium]
MPIVAEQMLGAAITTIELAYTIAIKQLGGVIAALHLLLIKEKIMFVNALKLFSWEGRICRRQYLLAFILIVFGTAILAAGVSDGRGSEGAAQVLMFLAQLALIPTQIKRLHDIGWSGWIILLALIPGINLILGLGLFLFSGTKGPNKYGEDPHTGK